MSDQLTLDQLAEQEPPAPEAEPRARVAAQLRELPGETFEDVFACTVDESAGLREDTA